METNYYIKDTMECPECGAPKVADYHIGKSSAGWCFSLHVDVDLARGVNDLGDIKRLWAYKTIKDEYGSTISKKEMLAIITERSWKRRSVEEMKKDPFYVTWKTFHKLNHSEDGPNGLLRHKIDGVHCIGHGDGTYDYLIGEFS